MPHFKTQLSVQLLLRTAFFKNCSTICILDERSRRATEFANCTSDNICQQYKHAADSYRKSIMWCNNQKLLTAEKKGFVSQLMTYDHKTIKSN